MKRTRSPGFPTTKGGEYTSLPSGPTSTSKKWPDARATGTAAAAATAATMEENFITKSVEVANESMRKEGDRGRGKTK